MSFLSFRKMTCPALPSPPMAVILVILVLQIWVCYECSCKVGAIRILPENGVEKLIQKNTTAGNMSKEEHFRRYFHERASSFNQTQKGFEESKRKVPSCPDPLHN